MNNHGWEYVGKLASFGGQRAGGPVHIAIAVAESKRCACTKVHCHRFMTQEDLLCDECRTECV